VHMTAALTAIKFWRQKEELKVYSVLPLIAQDFVQALTEIRLFSVCGILTASRCNRIENSLQMCM